MNKLFKRVSAVVLAGAMTLSMSVAALAADLSVYIRTSQSTTTAVGDTITTNATITGWPVTTGVSFVVSGVTADETLYEALQSGTVNTSDQLVTTWNANKYLKNLTWMDSDDEITYQGLENGSYKDLVSDGQGGYSSGTWDGYSWMWAPATLKDVVSYPNDTLDEVTCGQVNYAIVLSYENSVYSWSN